MDIQPKILALDDDSKFLAELKTALDCEFTVKTVTTVADAMQAISQFHPDVLLLDMNMPGASGMQILRVVHQRVANLPIIMLTAETKTELIVRAIQDGASDYVIKDSDDVFLGLKIRISRILALNGIRKQNEVLSLKVKEANSKYEILGISAATIRLRDELSKYKGTNAYILIQGENGTGKELIARTANLQENDPSRPFITVNCGAIPHNLFESELFGHTKGSFTGAIADQRGKFVAANGGDIFLDEIGELPLDMQVKLLRVLQERVVTPVGSTKGIAVNVRVIAATNKKLEELVKEGRFRQDLFFRLNQIVVKTPPLRARPDDILHLAQIFANKELPGVSISKEAKECLQAHTWPGNIRELENTIARACILVRGSSNVKILPEHLMLSDLEVGIGISIPANLFPKKKEDVTKERHQKCLDWMQKHFLQKALDIFGGDNNLVIEHLNISRAYFYQKKKELGLSKEPEARFYE